MRRYNEHEIDIVKNDAGIYTVNLDEPDMIKLNFIKDKLINRDPVWKIVAICSQKTDKQGNPSQIYIGKRSDLFTLLALARELIGLENAPELPDLIARNLATLEEVLNKALIDGDYKTAVAILKEINLMFGINKINIGLDTAIDVPTLTEMVKKKKNELLKNIENDKNKSKD